MRLLTGAAITALMTLSAAAQEPMRMCHPGERNGPEKHCVVDGDTIWFYGANLRLQDFDTPEPTAHNSKCPQGQTALEVELAAQASARLLELINTRPFTVEQYGVDTTGNRWEGTVRIDGVDVGDILIEEGLAREWPDGSLFWC
ncbi:thermonuclease family protein [Devosia elaeis]|uniref:TNase-like domain-containing protein n=1 Tax=Devosia elaeis TaxID=1770058 RepID=A0A178I3Y4_9HYPH|nr:hypothetical protein [Devosia elaeis]OAM79014.1 hypothetical protein A3840_04120 [Devosia elaeis]